jgi:4-aminobutyrate aminotransferase-like enzyme
MTNVPIRHPGEERSNELRRLVAEREPAGQRTFTPTQLVIERSEGVFHWTPEGRKLYDYTSGVLVANLGHHPPDWNERFAHWSRSAPLTAYNAISSVEAEAVRRLTDHLRARPGGRRCEQILWAASGSEAVQKALWASLARDPQRSLILSTRDGFHGKKGLAEAVTGTEQDRNRDPRVRFLSFPKEERRDLSMRREPFDPSPYAEELRRLETDAPRIACLITEPYLGGAGSFHPPKAYLQLLQDFCRRHDIVFILDEIQSNFGRTGSMFAFETYGLEPDIVVLGKGLGNGVPVAAAAGRAEVLGALGYGEGSDTYSGHPLGCAAVAATLDVFESRDILGPMRRVSGLIERELSALKDLPFVRHVRGEEGGMVWGVEISDFAGRSAADVANACVLAAYRGDGQGRAVHLMGPLAKKVLRIAPPLVISEAEARDSLAALRESFRSVDRDLASPVASKEAHG